MLKNKKIIHNKLYSFVKTMIGHISLVNDERKIEENFEKLRQKKCDSHNKYKATYCCTNFSCIKNSTSFLCEFCYKNHSQNHLNCQEIKSVGDLFSMKRLTQMKEDCKIDSSHEEKINVILQDVDHVFGELKESFCNIIDEECKKVKFNIQQTFSLDNEYIMKLFKEHEQVLLDIFTKDTIITNFNLTINLYLESLNKISETFRMQIEIVENLDKNIDLFRKNFPKIKQKHKNIVESIQQNISNFDELYENLNFIDHLRSAKLNDILLQKLDTAIISSIDKKIPRLHTDTIYKIISYDNNTKYITCSGDKTIILRNCEDNTVIRILSDHKELVQDILLLSDGRLASSSADKTIKIWNLTNGDCEQTLFGHSHWVYCLLELSNSILLSGSEDSSIGVWDISQKDHKELQFYDQVKNDKQSIAFCMTLINVDELAISSAKDINIYSFDNITIKSFNVIKTLKGHTNWVNDIKLMHNSKDMLVSCSDDTDCRLWSISDENCLRVFKGHSDQIWSIQILSDKIFVSASIEVIFFNIDSTEGICSITPDQSGHMIVSLIKNGSDKLVFAGDHDFIGVIKIYKHLNYE